MEPSRKGRGSGIDRSQGLMNNFFSNDWLHGVLVENDRLKHLRNTALIFLGFEIVGSAGVLYHTQSQNVSD